MTAEKAKKPEITPMKKSTAIQHEPGSVVLESEDGTTTIRPDVVAKIAGLAIREVDGVHELVPFGTGQAITKLAKSVGGADYRKLGVHVEVGQVEAAVDARIVTDYRRNIPQIAEAIRTSVGERIMEMTGLRLKELNLEVVDLYFGDEQEDEPESDRVQ